MNPNPNGTDRVPVVIVEDDPVVLRALVRIVKRAEGFHFAGGFPDAHSALKSLPGLNPGLVLMDVHLPGMSGIECVRHLRELMPGVQILMLTVYEDAPTVFAALKAGASGYLLKRSRPAEIVEAMRDLLAGGAPMSSEIARCVVHSFRSPLASAAGSKNPSTEEQLSPKEAEIAELLAKGLLVKEIADRTESSINTVKTHIKRIYQKLHVRSRTEAVVRILQPPG